MRYRLIALDLDGTAMVDGEQPSPAVRKAVAAAQARGAHVVVATGRPYRSAAYFAGLLDLRDPAICFQGAVVKEIAGRKATLLSEAMPRGPLTELLDLAEERKWELLVHSERAIHLPRILHPQSYYDFWFGLDLELGGSYAEILRTLDEQGLPALKCLIVGEPADLEAMQLELSQRFAGRLNVVRSQRMFVEATAPGTSKGKALAFLANHLGVPREETIAVGDSGNDISMIRWAGLGVAMASGFPDVIAAADWVAPPVSEDGVAAVIEKYVLGDE